jgi:hypothetical protein
MDSFWEKVWRTFDQISKYQMKILFVNFNGKIGWEGAFKQIVIGNDSLHKPNDDNESREVNSVISAHPVTKSTMFLPISIYKYISPDGKTLRSM